MIRGYPHFRTPHVLNVLPHTFFLGVIVFDHTHIVFEGSRRTRTLKLMVLKVTHDFPRHVMIPKRPWHFFGMAGSTTKQQMMGHFDTFVDGGVSCCAGAISWHWWCHLQSLPCLVVAWGCGRQTAQFSHGMACCWAGSILYLLLPWGFQIEVS